MKRICSFIIPVLTVLIVFAAIFLPQKLSQLQDRHYIWKLHSEAFTDENNLPSQHLSYSQRVYLLSCWSSDGDIVSAYQKLTLKSSYADAESAVYKELNSLSDCGVIPSELIPDDFSDMILSRMYLQRQNMSTSYILASCEAKSEGIFIFMIIDEVTGYALWFELESPAIEKYEDKLTPYYVGDLFFEHLGLDASMLLSLDYDAQFLLEKINTVYTVSVNASHLQVIPAPYQDSDSYSYSD